MATYEADRSPREDVTEGYLAGVVFVATGERRTATIKPDMTGSTPAQCVSSPVSDAPPQYMSWSRPDRRVGLHS